jgi:hypothetical protein
LELGDPAAHGIGCGLLLGRAIVGDELSEAEMRAIEDYLVDFFANGRGYLSSLFFGIGLATLSVGVWKIVVVCAVVYFLHFFRFGSRRLEQISLLMLALGIVAWIDIAPVNTLIAHVKLQTTAAMARLKPPSLLE